MDKEVINKIRRMGPKKRGELRQKVVGMIEEIRGRINEAKNSNPFWFYEPSDGNIDDGRRELMGRWLKEDDIPKGRLDSQIDAHKSKAGIIGVSGGNRSGKSTMGVIEAYIWATGEVPMAMKSWYPEDKIPKEFPQHIRVISVDHKTLLSALLPEYQKWCPREYLVGDSWEKNYSHETRVLELRKDNKLYGTLEFMTNQQDVESFQGPAKHGMIYDEEPRFDIYKENLMRFATADRLKILFCMTPTRGITWIKEAIVDKCEKDKIEWYKMPAIVNKHVNVKTLDEVLSGPLSYDEIKMKLLGEFVSLSGLIYGRLFDGKVGGHVIEPFELNDDYFVVRGIDPHLVKPSVCVEVAIDREGNEYVVGTYSKDCDTLELKKDLADRAKERKYRLGWSICDKSADSTIKVFGNRNIFLELKQGENAIPGLFSSEKYTGSINAGVDEIKKLLKIDEKTKKPKLFFFNIPENKLIINAMQNLERDTYENEERQGMRDKILEGKHDAHAALRYIHQRPVRWMPKEEKVFEYVPVNSTIGY